MTKQKPLKNKKTMETKKRKLRYAEISEQRMNQFLQGSDYPRRYWAIYKIENDQNKTANYIKWLETEMDSTHDHWELSGLIAKRNIAVAEFFAQRKCLTAIKDYTAKLQKEYEAQHPAAYTPTREEEKRWKTNQERRGENGRGTYFIITRP